MSPTVSIIVPVYNAEKSIRRCIDSVLNQEYEDFELLLIDDGSKDSSGVLCDEYAAADQRVKVTHKENSGVSDARNLALDLAKGKYLQFLDSDDWITSDATRLLVSAALEHDCDLVISDFYRVVGERVSHKGDIETEGTMTQEEFAACMMEDPADFYYGVLWNKLYRREIVEKYHLRMDSAISWCEDFMFNLEYIRYAQTFYALRAPIYYYVKTKGSLVSQGISISKTIKMKLMVFEYYNNFYKHVLNEEDYEKNRLQVYRFLVDSAGDSMALPIISDARKLGNERIGVYSEALTGEGIVNDFYRSRKLLEHYLEVAALKYDLSIAEVKMLQHVDQIRNPLTRKELQDFTGFSYPRMTALLQKLISRGFLKMEEQHLLTGESGRKQDRKAKKTRQRKLLLSITDAALPVLREIKLAQDQYEETIFAEFSEEELMQYTHLSEKIKKNIREIL